MIITIARSPTSQSAELETLKADGMDKINAYAGKIRRKYISDIIGQDMMYLRKEQEAIEYLRLSALTADPVSLDDFPFLRREALALGQSGYELSQVILYQAQLWLDIGPRMEGLRVGAGDDLSRALSGPEIDLIISDFETNMGIF